MLWKYTVKCLYLGLLLQLIALSVLCAAVVTAVLLFKNIYTK
jgi:hypothetical protein